MSDFGSLSRGELQAMAEAAREVMNCQRVLAKTGDNIVGEILRGAGTFYEWRHYPSGDVYDAEFHAQYYYHAHPEEERVSGEHGHFHTFLRPLGMPPGIVPARLFDVVESGGENDALCHLVGISMDRAGLPIRLFTTNRWVTGETWYASGDVARMLDCFVIDHARPSWVVNRWITALIRLFRLQIVELLEARDAEIARWRDMRPGTNIHEDRELEVVSERWVSIEDQIARIELALTRARRREGVVAR
ncbi:hypothetical protein N825_31040 [Skermanella stibiiresistens SB22]|uniref:DUF6969 domain-containing protein n=1 Tax=Skermanella stibiiresistens SB22 TaxID=1385369 RepID=W9H8U2_9PROT|nr:hypothetical protein [Skermanella stibiiresistens]EWY41102.1 hypothetical protein N825_31040 [Skermanella stibiiresistens SB22]